MIQMLCSESLFQALDISTIGTEIDASSAALPNTISTTLHDHLNRCRSQAGKTLIRDWLRRPLFSLPEIEERLNVVEALFTSASARQSLHEDLLRRVPDIALLTRKLIQKKATLQDCYRTYQFILLLDKIEHALKNMEGQIDAKLYVSVKELILQKLQQSKAEFGQFVALVESTMDLDFYEQSGQHRIKPEIDDELASINGQIIELDGKAQKLLRKLADRINREVKLESNVELGYFFRITLKSETALRSISDVRVLDTSKGGGVRFITKSLEPLTDKYRDLMQTYEAGQAELTSRVIDTCAGYVPALKSLSQYIGILDVLTAFSVVAAASASSYVRPKILDKGTGILELRQCRHPVVENLPGMQFIPNDLVMRKDTEDSGSFIVLTGANMGGKSTYLKAAALTVLMGQMGSFVPCESATFSMVDGIFTRVGAGDFQCKGISTFMAEMIDCTTILEKATANSLILIDELGRGTSTYDGFGLAWAIAEDIIRRINCFSLFATHFHEMSKLEEKYPGKVKNYRMETLVEDAKLTILFQIVPGVADQSFGLNIAEMVGFSEEIIEDAKNILHHLENTSALSQNVDLLTSEQKMTVEK